MMLSVQYRVVLFSPADKRVKRHDMLGFSSNVNASVKSDDVLCYAMSK